MSDSLYRVQQPRRRQKQAGKGGGVIGGFDALAAAVSRETGRATDEVGEHARRSTRPPVQRLDARRCVGDLSNTCSCGLQLYYGLRSFLVALRVLREPVRAELDANAAAHTLEALYFLVAPLGSHYIRGVDVVTLLATPCITSEEVRGVINEARTAMPILPWDGDGSMDAVGGRDSLIEFTAFQDALEDRALAFAFESRIQARLHESLRQ